MREHHAKCPKAQAWDIGGVPCECPPGWPRRIEPPETIEVHEHASPVMPIETREALNEMYRLAVEHFCQPPAPDGGEHA